MLSASAGWEPCGVKRSIGCELSRPGTDAVFAAATWNMTPSNSTSSNGTDANFDFGTTPFVGALRPGSVLAG